MSLIHADVPTHGTSAYTEALFYWERGGIKEENGGEGRRQNKEKEEKQKYCG